MLDFLKLKISTRFMKGIIAKIMSRKIYKQFGYKVDIQLNDIQVDMVDGDIQVHIDVDGKMNKTEFSRLMGKIEEEA